MSLVFDAVIIVGGLALGRWIARSVRGGRPRTEPRAAEKPTEGSAGVLSARRPAAASDPFAALPCRLGDVVVRVVERDEAWLAGALVLEEDRPVAAVFVAPEAGGDRAVFARDAPGAGVTWLWPLAARDLPLTKEPPHALEHVGVHFERARRLPVRVARVGTGTPDVGDRAVLAEYHGPGTQRIVVLAGAERTVAWKGVALDPAEYDVLPGGGAPT